MRLARGALSTSSIALMALLTACSDSPQEPALEECPDNQVSLAVSEGPTPTFSWAPQCGMASLDLFPSAGGASLWVLYSGEQAAANPFRSGIVYGHAPRVLWRSPGPRRFRRGPNTPSSFTGVRGRPAGAAPAYRPGWRGFALDPERVCATGAA
jgi:hypothetical protein